jgi:hypothetical protein
MRLGLSFVAGVALLFGAGQARASDAPIAIEVSTKVVRPDLDLPPLLRAVAEAEVSHLDLSAVPKDAKLVLSVALVRIDTTRSSSGATVSCLVSATLSDAQKGSIFAVLEGRSNAQSKKVEPAVERAAVRAAVRGAVSGLPRAIQ